MNKVRVRLDERSYSILMGRNLLKDCGKIIKNLHIGDTAVVITNPRLSRLYRRPLEKSLKKSGFYVRFETVPDSERAKSARVAASLIRRISAFDKRRKIFVVAFGGGVVGDLAGFVASIYKRGIAYVQVPTTLLAQVDSAIGGKVAIDLPVAKNLVGSFYQPKLVISDISALKTLSIRQVRNGLSEIIKYGIIKDPALFVFLEKNYKKILSHDASALEYVIARSSRIKAAVVAEDEFDKKGSRVLLNLGHTMGHAIEKASGYSRYNHGEAVAIGMAIACGISLEMGLIEVNDAERILRLIDNVGLPAKIEGLRFSDIYESHLHDKKFNGTINRYVLPAGIGKATVVSDVPDSIVRNALKEALA